MNFRRLVILGFLSLAPVSCVKELVVVQERSDWDIVMNASLTAGDNLQSVYLSKAWSMHTDRLRGATVTGQIGDHVFTAEELTEADWGHAALYVLDMPLHPGEMVTLTATSEGKTARATVTVPLPGKISNLKMLPLIQNVWFTADLSDPGSGEDFFQLTGEVRTETPYSSGSAVYVNPLWINAWGDAVLSDGNPRSGSGESMVEDLLSELYGDGRILFSDRYFSNGKASVRFSVDTDAFPEEENPDTKGSVAFRLTTYTRAHYRYLKAVAAADVVDSPELLMFVEPVTIPCNVTGGLGFVGAVSYDEAVCLIP